jgi:peptidoglycan/xylan/chitin deacetylase (PgdA/CDA1 family)
MPKPPEAAGVVRRGGAGRPEVALTYDDGPGRSTREVMDVLEKHRARATFFMLGTEVQRDPGLAREVLARGHEVGSHSMRHLNHVEVGAERAVEDMLAGADAIAEALGVEPRLYRAPYGGFVPATVAEAQRRGWTCVHWSAVGRDWEVDATAQSVADRVMRKLSAGLIALLHDSPRTKPRDPEPVTGATAILLDELAARSLRQRTVGEMLA